jgi:sporulation protein YlmC with PRC-barrel domain
MGSNPAPPFVKLSHSDFEVESVDEDVRGRKVVTVNGDQIGTVDDLLIDREDQTVRFLEVSSGGFLGFGERTSLIPVEAISEIDERHVYVDLSREHVAAAPAHNPHVVHTVPYLNDVYEHYGYAPPWTPGADSR